VVGLVKRECLGVFPFSLSGVSRWFCQREAEEVVGGDPCLGLGDLVFKFRKDEADP
jgi:hypothetical protein